MPYFNASKREECILETIDVISFLESVIENHPLHKVVIGGDFNTEMKGQSPFDSHWTEFMAKYDMSCCDNLVTDKNPCYTYNHDTLNQQKWIDHFVMSNSLLPNSKNHSILDKGDNPSDHLPLMMQMSACLLPCPPPEMSSTKKPSLKWEKCNDNQISEYTNALSFLLSNSVSHLTNCQ